MTFVKYLLKKFIPAFLGSLMFFAMVLELVDILMMEDSFLELQQNQILKLDLSLNLLKKKKQ